VCDELLSDLIVPVMFGSLLIQVTDIKASKACSLTLTTLITVHICLPLNNFMLRGQVVGFWYAIEKLDPTDRKNSE